MNPDTDFKSLWSRQEMKAAPDFNVIVTQASQLKKKTRNRLLLVSAVLLAAIILVLLIVNYAHPKMITTTIGAVITIIAIALYIVASASILPALYKSNPGNSTSEYLKQLIEVKRKTQFIHKTVFTLYFILLSGGILLYIFEYVEMMSFMGKVLAYGVIVLWIAFNWQYTRKRRIAKDQVQINEMINKLEMLSASVKGK